VNAPVDPDALDRSLRAFGLSTMLPAAAYTGDDVLAWELRHLFAGTWPCLGRAEELGTADVTQRALLAGDIPVLLTFAGGQVRAFANTCRHRGHELLEGSSDSTVVRCPYHCWVYGLDGTLRAAPGFRQVATFRPEEYPLVELPCETWHGWVFVNATGDAAPFTGHVGALAGILAPYRPESLHLRARHSYDVAANWKVVCENYHECYHCPQIHPELCRVSPPASGAWVGGSMELRSETMSLSGRSAGPPLPAAPVGRVEYLGLVPNLLLSLHPDYVMTHRLVPLAPDRTWVECSWYFGSADVDPSYAVEFWDLVNSQDWRACESVQRGLASPHFRPGPFAPNEDAVHRWVTMIGRAYRGIPPHLQEG
jgi:Rieske 2Fe-2S family protein